MKKKNILIILAILALDLITKHFAQAYLQNTSALVLVPNFFSLTYVTNTGAAWSILEGQRWFFIVLSIIVIGVLIYYLINEDNKLINVALSLMISGTAGNLYDRIMHGHVRDMLSFNLFGYQYPVFNIADSALVVGVFLIVLDMFISERRLKHE